MISHDMISHETSRVFEIQQINAAGATKFGAFGAWILKYVIEHTTNVNFQGKGAAWDKLGVDGSRKCCLQQVISQQLRFLRFCLLGK